MDTIGKRHYVCTLRYDEMDDGTKHGEEAVIIELWLMQNNQVNTHRVEITDDLQHNGTDSRCSCLIYLQKLLNNLQQAWAADTPNQYNDSNCLQWEKNVMFSPASVCLSVCKIMPSEQSKRWR